MRTMSFTHLTKFNVDDEVRYNKDELPYIVRGVQITCGRMFSFISDENKYEIIYAIQPIGYDSVDHTRALENKLEKYYEEARSE